jgi:hypothetical protein
MLGLGFFTVGRTPWRPLPAQGWHKQNKSTQTPRPWMILEPTLPVPADEDGSCLRPRGHSDRYRDNFSFVSNGYQGLFPRGWRDWGLELTTQLPLVPMSLPQTSSWRGVPLTEHGDNFGVQTARHSVNISTKFLRAPRDTNRILSQRQLYK